MPYALHQLGGLQNICGSIPLAGTLLPGEHKPGGVSTSEPRDEGRQVLASTSLRIGNLPHGIGKLAALHRSFAVMFPPRAEELCYALALGILGLQHFDAFNRITAAQGKERVSAPLRPRLEAS
jgi:hypothetical protein